MQLFGFARVGEVARLAADAAEDLDVVEREAHEDLAQEIGGEAEEGRHRRKTAATVATTVAREGATRITSHARLARREAR